jgi:hypothetical protein
MLLKIFDDGFRATIQEQKFQQHNPKAWSVPDCVQGPEPVLLWLQRL